MITSTIEAIATCERCGTDVEVQRVDAATIPHSELGGLAAVSVAHPDDWTTLTIERGSDFGAASYRRSICSTCTGPFPAWWYRQSTHAQPLDATSAPANVVASLP